MALNLQVLGGNKASGIVLTALKRLGIRGEVLGKCWGCKGLGLGVHGFGPSQRLEKHQSQETDNAMTMTQLMTHVLGILASCSSLKVEFEFEPEIL